MRKILDNSDLPTEERAKLEKLAEELDCISPFAIGAKEIEPFWFGHPEYKTVFCKIGPTADRKRVLATWVTMTSDHKHCVFLTARLATKRETEYFRYKISNA